MSGETFVSYAYWPRRGQVFLLTLALIAMLCAARGDQGAKCSQILKLTRIGKLDAAGTGAALVPPGGVIDTLRWSL